MSRLSRLATIGVLLVTASGCATLGRRHVSELQNNPGRYQNRTVRISGTVTSSWGVPLLPFKMYRVDDGTGEMTVLSQSMRTPTRGARVSVKGRVDDVAVLGGRAVGLHLREEKISIGR